MNIAYSGLRDYDATRKEIVKAHTTMSNHLGGRARVTVGDCPTGLDKRVREEAAHIAKVWEADWETHGNAAGPIRTEDMIRDEETGALVAFWNGETRQGRVGRGTFNAIRFAAEKGIPVLIMPVNRLLKEVEDE